MPERWYEVHVRGEIPPDAMDEFEGLTAVLEPAETIISGVVSDQAALQGILARVHALGLELVEVRRLPGGEAPAPTPTAGQP